MKLHVKIGSIVTQLVNPMGKATRCLASDSGVTGSTSCRPKLESDRVGCKVAFKWAHGMVWPAGNVVEDGCHGAGGGAASKHAMNVRLDCHKLIGTGDSS